jgi:hypothetical protein
MLLPMENTRIQGVDEATVVAIAAEAEADPRTVWKRLAGGRVRGRVAARIDRAIAARLRTGDARMTPADATAPARDQGGGPGGAE